MCVVCPWIWLNFIPERVSCWTNSRWTNSAVTESRWTRFLCVVGDGESNIYILPHIFFFFLLLTILCVLNGVCLGMLGLCVIGLRSHPPGVLSEGALRLHRWFIFLELHYTFQWTLTYTSTFIISKRGCRNGCHRLEIILHRSLVRVFIFQFD